MKKLFVLLLVLCAVPLLASNMGFKAQINKAPTGANAWWISVPYFYTPADDPGGVAGQVDAQDMCADATSISSIFYWDTAAGSLVGWGCNGYGTPFTLTKGASYQFAGDGIATIQWTAVGSHDPSFGHTYAPSGANSWWVSVPYHWNPADDPGGVASVKDAQDLCAEGSGISSIFIWDASAGSLTGWGCNGYGTPFALDVFNGVQFAGDGAATITWTPSHY